MTKLMLSSHVSGYSSQIGWFKGWVLEIDFEFDLVSVVVTQSDKWCSGQIECSYESLTLEE